MRFAGGLFLQQAVARGGAQLEGDGEITLPPVLQPGLLIDVPISVSNSGSLPASPVSTSFLQRLGFVRRGVIGTTNITDTQTLAAGIWRIESTISFQATLNSSAPNAGILVNFQMVDPDGNTTDIFSVGYARIVQSFAFQKNFWLNTLRDGFSFRIGVPISGINDDMHAQWSLYFHKVL